MGDDTLAGSGRRPGNGEAAPPHVGFGGIDQPRYDGTGPLQARGSDGAALIFCRSPVWQNRDQDQDTLDDDFERIVLKTSPRKVDSDDDGKFDIDELMVIGTDPARADTDSDGIIDGEEIDVYLTNPLASDTDGDGLLDGQEVYIYNTDPLKSDSDKDGITDGAEVKNYGTDPLKFDTDDDGLSDQKEIATYFTDPLLIDTDGDTLGDGDEVNVYHSDPLSQDGDGDGISDQDEVGLKTDPLNLDSDGDGIFDGDEVSIGTSPRYADSDGDGYSDGEEVRVAPVLGEDAPVDSQTWDAPGEYAYVVPAGCDAVDVRAWGAGGGTNWQDGGDAPGGGGGFASVLLSVDADTSFRVFVGEGGRASGMNGKAFGGARGGNTNHYGGGGGGSSDLWLGETRLLVAGGGGGAGLNALAVGGAGGGTSGQDGGGSNSGKRGGAGGDALGLDPDGEDSQNHVHAGAGGGGWSGGRAAPEYGAGGGGGSSFGHRTVAGDGRRPGEAAEAGNAGYGGVGPQMYDNLGPDQPSGSDGLVKLRCHLAVGTTGGTDPLDPTSCPGPTCGVAGDGDTDGDGVNDTDEVALGTDRFLEDSDGDGLWDGTEVALGSDPLHTDSDGDGLADGDEWRFGSLPTAGDSDGDGVDDPSEVDALEWPNPGSELTGYLLSDVRRGAGASTWRPPAACMEMKVMLWGAGGGTNWDTGSHATGGGGGFASKTLAPWPDESFELFIGEGGRSGANVARAFGGAMGGRNTSYGGGGGGSTELRQAGQRLVVAGGGGGGGNSYAGGAGGGTTGGPGASAQGGPGGDSSGLQPDGEDMSSISHVGAGGGGYSGGKAGLASGYGGGGGSSFGDETLAGSGRLPGNRAASLPGAGYGGSRLWSEFTPREYPQQANGTDGALLVYCKVPQWQQRDFDGDGIDDDLERNRLKTSYMKTDSDGDNLTDIYELMTSGTRPDLPDTDGDGLSDGDEILTHQTSPFVADHDGDGLRDGDEVLVYDSNPLVVDTDVDGLRDGFEVSIGTDPTLEDSDADGADDSVELLVGTDPLDQDTDGDTLTDGDELFVYYSDPLSEDGDFDTISDVDEVAIGSNPLSSDSDADGISDPDEVALGTSPSNADTDSDGYSDGEEYISYPQLTGEAVDEATWSSSGEYEYVVPSGCNAVSVQAWGAGGGTNWDNGGEAAGGGGGYAESVLSVTAGSTYRVFVGQGGRASGMNGKAFGGARGGATDHYGGGGGGSSDLWLGEERLVVAGGGGGAGIYSEGVGGAGGGTVGSDGGDSAWSNQGGAGGLSSGRDSDGEDANGQAHAGAGGGGWSGGRAAGNYGAGGGGGSSRGQVTVAGRGRVPGNAEQAGDSGYGGVDARYHNNVGPNQASGADGRVSIACYLSESFTPTSDPLDPFSCPAEFCGVMEFGGGPEAKVPAGQLMMNGRMVTLTRSLAVMRTEVTQALWKEMSGGANPSRFPNCDGGSGDTCPVERIDWYAAIAFANALSASRGLQQCYVLTGCDDPVSGWKDGRHSGCYQAAYDSVFSYPWHLDCNGYRLPTFAEWNWLHFQAAPAPDQVGSFGVYVDDVAWYQSNSDDSTHPVGLKLPNIWGLYDTSGNVMEWVWGSSDSLRSADPVVDPVAPPGDWPDNKGGAYDTPYYLMVPGGSGIYNPSFEDPSHGVRLVRTLPEDENEVVVPGGVFDRDGHEVSVSGPLSVMVHEVSQARWKRFSGGVNPASFDDCDGAGGDGCPVDSIDWYSAIAYANALSVANDLEPCYEIYDCTEPGVGWLDGSHDGCTGAAISAATLIDCSGYRIPTEAEWEYLYRAGTFSSFYSGDQQSDVDRISWHSGNSSATTHPIGEKEPNAYGMCDMAGNVSEWIWDWSASYPPNSVSDYTGPASGTQRVIRGGSWTDSWQSGSATAREAAAPTVRNHSTGMRLIRSLP